MPFKKIALAVLCSVFLLASGLSAQTAQPAAATYESLLSGYYDNDMRMKELNISIQQAEISYQKTLINNELTYQLSTGSLSLEAGKNTFGISISPEASVTIPEKDNLSVKASAPVSVKTNSGTTTTSLNNAGVTVSKDIISTTAETTAINMEKAERSLGESYRKLYSRQIALEKEFLSSLKSLFSSRSSLLKAQSTLLDKQDALNNLKMQGYLETSSKYRSAVLAEKSAARKLEEAERSFGASLSSFAEKCGVSADDIDLTTIIIPDEELLSITDFDASLYTELESALWSQYINGRTRANKSDWTLSANGSVSVSASTADRVDTTASVKGGVSATYRGLTASANLSVPIGSDQKTSSLTMSLTWKPSTQRTKDLDEQSAALTALQEELSIEQARSSYEDTVENYETKRDNLLWQLEEQTDEVEMYKALADDMKGWYDQGYISESEYKNSVTQYEDALAALNTTKIDFLTYNRDVEALFIQEGK